jgi:hypothetical protein
MRTVSGEFGAAHQRHPLVADNDVHQLALYHGQGCVRLAGDEHPVAGSEEDVQGSQDPLVVVDE